MHLLRLAALLFLSPLLPLQAAELRVLPAGELPKDARLGPAKDLDGYFPFTPSASPEAWQARAEEVRQQIRVALGIWPAPERTPLHAVIHGRIDRDDYTVEKVRFESMPGFFVTGNLYRPKPTPGETGRKYPAILNPHGHWADGRFYAASDQEVKQLLATGAEHFESAARSLLQARPVQLARMGCIVFHYDMLGYADSNQISLQLAHKFAKQRAEMNTPENWGLYSPQAESHAQSVLGLQIWNGVRALDFLCSLPDVDPTRLGMTGASGGGTQTMLLSAIDPRISVSCPAVMVSTAMQGGCTCENASLLRVGTGNIEFAALFAPKPMAMTAANDWTKEMPTKGYPDLQRHWAMLGAPEKVHLTALLQFPHNYNSPSRAAMDRWFNRYFNLGLSDAALAERDFKLLTREEMSVWDNEHPAPEGGADFERKLLHWWHEDSQRQLLKSPADFQKIAGPAVRAIIGRSPGDADTQWVKTIEKDCAGLQLTAGFIRGAAAQKELPVVSLRNSHWNGNIILWLDPRGKAALFDDGAELAPSAEVRALVDSGASVVGFDLLGEGEFLRDGQPFPVRRVSNPRESAAYTFGYNPSLFAERARDISTIVTFLKGTHPRSISIVASGNTGPIAAASRAILGNVISAAVLETNGFRFADINDFWSPDFLPAAAKYGDLPGMLALAAPQPLYLLGEKSAPSLVRDAYAAANPAALRVGPQTDRAAALEWLKESLRNPVTP